MDRGGDGIFCSRLYCVRNLRGGVDNGTMDACWVAFYFGECCWSSILLRFSLRKLWENHVFFFRLTMQSCHHQHPPSIQTVWPWNTPRKIPVSGGKAGVLNVKLTPTLEETSILVGHHEDSKEGKREEVWQCPGGEVVVGNTAGKKPSGNIWKYYWEGQDR